MLSQSSMEHRWLDMASIDMEGSKRAHYDVMTTVPGAHL